MPIKSHATHSVNYYANDFVNYFSLRPYSLHELFMIHYSNRLFALNLLSVNYLLRCLRFQRESSKMIVNGERK
jgi:hypothetical protein